MSRSFPAANKTTIRDTSDQTQENRSTRGRTLTSICQPVRSDLWAVENILADRRQHRIDRVQQLLLQTPLSGGKRMRPILLLLSGACTGEISQSHHQLAAAIELVHAASIVHDDVLDNAETRRHMSTVNAVWDNSTSVLLGDYLFAQAFDIAAETGNVEALRRIARSSACVCEGEIKQNALAGNLELTELDYTEIIQLKTAELCKCACGLGALASGADATTVSSYESFGQSLGIAFQIIDDVLDLVGDPQRVGKTLGTDLASQKMTLPLIHSLKHGIPSNRTALLHQLALPTPDQDLVLNLLSSSRSIDYAREKARGYAQVALDFADGIPVCQYSTALRQLADFVLKRTY